MEVQVAQSSISPNSRQLANTIKVQRRTPDYIFDSLVEYLDPDIASPEDFAACASNERANELAVQRYGRDQADGWVYEEVAVYVVRPENGNYAKVGISANPLKRLQGLAGASWERLSIHALFWVVKGSAYELEQMALRVAKESGFEKRGEWIGTDAASLAYIVAAAAHRMKIKVADSRLWLRGRENTLVMSACHAAVWNEMNPRVV